MAAVHAQQLLYNQDHWFGNGSYRAVFSSFDDDIWSDLLSPSHNSLEMPDEEAPKPELDDMDRGEKRNSDSVIVVSQSPPAANCFGDDVGELIELVRSNKRPRSMTIHSNDDEKEISNEQESSTKSWSGNLEEKLSAHTHDHNAHVWKRSQSSTSSVSAGSGSHFKISVSQEADSGVSQVLTPSSCVEESKKGQMTSPDGCQTLQDEVKHMVEKSVGQFVVLDHREAVDKSDGLSTPFGAASAFLDSTVPRESHWAQQLLLECAVAISCKNFVRTQHLMWVLNDLSCLTGDANQRLAGYGLKALFCKASGSEQLPSCLKNLLEQSSFSPKSLHGALLKFHDVNPWHQMPYSVANSVMIDAFEGEDKVHVIDIGVSQGTQWPTFIEALATRGSGPPSLLRLTLIEDNSRVCLDSSLWSQVRSSRDYMPRLERFAKLMGINIEVSTIVSSLGELTGEKLLLRDGEVLAICAQFRLCTLPENVERQGIAGDFPLSPRDSFLKFLHSLQPKVMVLSENDTDNLSPDFLTCFRGVIDYFWKFLDSTNFSFHGKQCEERDIIEREEAMVMIWNVACEDSQRINRNESHMGWAERMKQAGFSSKLPREEILENTRTLIRKYDSNWAYTIDTDCMILLWKHQPATFCSVWKSY